MVVSRKVPARKARNTKTERVIYLVGWRGSFSLSARTTLAVAAGGNWKDVIFMVKITREVRNATRVARDGVQQVKQSIQYFSRVIHRVVVKDSSNSKMLVFVRTGNTLDQIPEAGVNSPRRRLDASGRESTGQAGECSETRSH